MRLDIDSVVKSPFGGGVGRGSGRPGFWSDSAAFGAAKFVSAIAVAAALAVGAAETVGFFARHSPALASSMPEGDESKARPADQENTAQSGWSARTQRIGLVLVGATIGLVAAGVLLTRRRSPAERLAKAFQAAGEMDPKAIFEKRQQIYNVLSSNVTAVLESRIEVRHVMSRCPMCVAPDASLDEVVRLMRENLLRHLLVCDSKERVVGVISDRDLSRKSGATAADVMTPGPATVEPTSLVDPAATLLIQRRISCLPVVKEGRLCGVLTSTDLMMTMQCVSQILKSALKQQMASQVPQSGPALADPPQAPRS